MRAAEKQSSGGLAANVINGKSCPTVAMRKSALEKSDLELLKILWKSIFVILLVLTDGRIKPIYR